MLKNPQLQLLRGGLQSPELLRGGLQSPELLRGGLKSPEDAPEERHPLPGCVEQLSRKCVME